MVTHRIKSLTTTLRKAMLLIPTSQIKLLSLSNPNICCGLFKLIDRLVSGAMRSLRWIESTLSWWQLKGKLRTLTKKGRQMPLPTFAS